MLYNVIDFVRWALTHVKRENILKSAWLPLPWQECGTDPWEYLYGSVRVQTNQPTLDRYFEQHYSASMSREKFDAYTKSWSRTGYATDCQGLLDAYLTHECGEKTDWYADYNYKYICKDKGAIEKIERPFRVGEAVFVIRESTGRMMHVGWVCGFMPDGEPLVVEARSIAYGVVVTKLYSRPWTHRGLMTTKFDYSDAPDSIPQPEQAEPVRLEYTRPMMEGEEIRRLQLALNALHYTDDEGKPLEEDGKCGMRTMQAVTAFARAHTEIPEPVTITALPPALGWLDLEQLGITVCAFRSADLPDTGGGEQ